MQVHKLSRFESILLSVTEPLLIYIISFWDLRDILTCGTLSSVLQNIVRYYKTCVWDPDRFFRPWFKDDAKLFRGILQRCGAVVSGSQILQFFDRTRYFDSDMDIFLRIGGVCEMGCWLTEQGYKFQSISKHYDAFSRSLLRLSNSLVSGQGTTAEETVKGVFNYKRYVATSTVVYLQKIQLVVVDTNPIQHIVFGFHSSESAPCTVTHTLYEYNYSGSYKLHGVRRDNFCLSNIYSPSA